MAELRIKRKSISRSVSAIRAGHHRAAFTLVEMMISLVVFSIVMLAMVSGTIALVRAFSAVDTYSTANADETRVLDFICRDVRNSLSSQSPQVIIATTPPGLQVTVPQYFSSSGTAITPTVSGTSVTYGTSPTTITYALNGTTLTRTEGGNTPTVLSSNMLSFTPAIDTAYDSTGRTVKITLTFNSTFRAAWSSIGTTLSTRVSTRP
ncbi:MAG: prepilin-type N-terminal cleavage/methylation domain-containing protein [Chthoniobacteraceae bacterium]